MEKLITIAPADNTDVVIIWRKNAKGLWPGQIKDQFCNRDTIQVVGQVKAGSYSRIIQGNYKKL